DRRALAALIVALDHGAQVPSRRREYREAVLAERQQAVDRDVAHARLRVLRDLQAGGDVRAAVLLVVAQDRQLREVDVLALPHHFLARGARDELRLDHAALALDVAREELVLAEAERLRDAALRAEQAAQHGELAAFDILENQRGAALVRRLARQRDDVVLGGDLIADADQVALRLQRLQEIADLKHS